MTAVFENVLYKQTRLTSYTCVKCEQTNYLCQNYLCGRELHKNNRIELNWISLQCNESYPDPLVLASGTEMHRSTPYPDCTVAILLLNNLVFFLDCSLALNAWVVFFAVVFSPTFGKTLGYSDSDISDKTWQDLRCQQQMGGLLSVTLPDIPSLFPFSSLLFLSDCPHMPFFL